MSRFCLSFSVLLLLVPWVDAEPHWSFQPRKAVKPPPVPNAADQKWARTAVDAFILKRLHQQGLKPAPQADRGTLIRRLYFDLTGLPPSPQEITAFVGDAKPQAYERLVERLLASPRYAEHWAQHWLDVVRYAETDGFEYDGYRPGMWRYRDYVIASIAEDKPYDRFVIEQLAGDDPDAIPKSLADPDKDYAFLKSAGQRASLGEVAAGYNRLGPVRHNAGNQNEAFNRNEVLTTMTDAIGMVFLGVTVGCARCHDHKFDDFPQVDYYRLQAFLAGTRAQNHILADKQTQDAWQKRTSAMTKEITRLKAGLAKADGTAKQTLKTKLAAAQSQLPAPLPATCSVHEGERSEVHVLKRGMIERQGKRVEAGFPTALVGAGSVDLVGAAKRKPRLALARWLTDPDHPLTARVFVNRVWQYHFGQGIVETPNDFGVNGSPPSHPELLDYLADEFVSEGMHLKPLHRLIVLSVTYRQASRTSDAALALKKDPANRLLWRFPRRRLSAEEIRDTMLAVAGRLNLKAGGESVKVPVEKDLVDLLYDPTAWHVTADPREYDRRSIYLLAKRNLRLPFGQVFDQPDLQSSCPRRETSTHALQSLELMNGKTANRLAEAFALRLTHEAGADHARQIDLAYRLATGRAPTTKEMALANEFLTRQSLREFALAMFNLNAFLYVD